MAAPATKSPVGKPASKRSTKTPSVGRDDALAILLSSLNLVAETFGTRMEFVNATDGTAWIKLPPSIRFCAGCHKPRRAETVTVRDGKPVCSSCAPPSPDAVTPDHSTGDAVTDAVTA